MTNGGMAKHMLSEYLPGIAEGARLTQSAWTELGGRIVAFKGQIDDEFYRYCAKWLETAVDGLQYGQKRKIGQAIFGESFRNIENIAVFIRNAKRFEDQTGIPVVEKVPLRIHRALSAAPEELKTEEYTRLSKGGKLPKQTELVERVKAAKLEAMPATAPRPQTWQEILKQHLSEPNLVTLAKAVECDPQLVMQKVKTILAVPSSFNPLPQDIPGSMLIMEAERHVAELSFNEEKQADEDPFFNEESKAMRERAYELYQEHASERKVAEIMTAEGIPMTRDTVRIQWNIENALRKAAQRGQVTA